LWLTIDARIKVEQLAPKDRPAKPHWGREIVIPPAGKDDQATTLEATQFDPVIVLPVRFATLFQGSYRYVSC